MPCMGFPFGKTGLTYVFTKKKKKTYVNNQTVGTDGYTEYKEQQ